MAVQKTVVHRTYRLRDTLEFLGACPFGRAAVERFVTAEEIQDYINMVPGETVPGMEGTVADMVDWFIFACTKVLEAGRRLHGLGEGGGSGFCPKGLAVAPSPRKWAKAKSLWMQVANKFYLYTDETRVYDLAECAARLSACSPGMDLLAQVSSLSGLKQTVDSDPARKFYYSENSDYFAGTAAGFVEWFMEQSAHEHDEEVRVAGYSQTGNTSSYNDDGYRIRRPTKAMWEEAERLWVAVSDQYGWYTVQEGTV